MQTSRQEKEGREDWIKSSVRIGIVANLKKGGGGGCKCKPRLFFFYFTIITKFAQTSCLLSYLTWFNFAFHPLNLFSYLLPIFFYRGSSFSPTFYLHMHTPLNKRDSSFGAILLVAKINQPLSIVEQVHNHHIHHIYDDTNNFAFWCAMFQKCLTGNEAGPWRTWLSPFTIICANQSSLKSIKPFFCCNTSSILHGTTCHCDQEETWRLIWLFLSSNN